MKARTLVALIPCAMLFACGRNEPPPTSPEPSATPPPAAPQTTDAASTTPAAAAHVTLAGPPNPAKDRTLISAISGNLQLATVKDGVQINGQINGLAPNTEHGFHVHQIGSCADAGFKSAGEHFNPDGVMHGAPTSVPHHLGDMLSLKSDATGTATVDTLISGATLNDGGAHDVLGKALILHAKPDDYKTQPSGDSGDRIACGVIEKLP